MIGEKLTFHIAAVWPRSTASPDCRTNRTGNGVDASSRPSRSCGPRSRLCSGWRMSPSPGTSGAPPLRVSPYAMNENFVTAADAASDASGVAGGSIGLTATHARRGRRRLRGRLLREQHRTESGERERRRSGLKRAATALSCADVNTAAS